MKTTRRCGVLAAALLAAGAVHAAGAVQVSFVKPENFADVRDRAYTAEQNLKTLEQVIVAAAQPHVPEGRTLKIEVLDVDLAGEVRPGLSAWDLRILRGRADWPRITLRWSLDGPNGGSGEAVVQDSAYLERVPPPLSGTPLVYERRMLEEWFRDRFGKAS